MLIPKKLKRRKWHRGRGGLAGTAQTGARIAFGAYALKAEVAGEITSRQIEAARRAISRSMKRGGKTWIRIFPHKPVTQKAAEVPMGSGKGSVELYVAAVHPGTVLFEVEGVTEVLAREALRLAGHKLGVKTRFVSKIAI
ncbi:MAG: 50S ribosomal protein L16 [Candidatus Peregrinibacteria bacterium]